MKKYNLALIKILFFLLFYSLGTQCYCQQITAGPIVGAVTDSSAQLLFITDVVSGGYIKVSTYPININNELLNNTTDVENTILHTFEIKDSIYKVCTEKINFLKPFTTYYYLAHFGKSNKFGSFKTFPDKNYKNDFSFTLGSCTEQHHDDSIFIEMQKHTPLFFLHLGDWLYTNNFNERKFYYAESLAHQAELYNKRYAMPNLQKMLQCTPIDFVFDDEDGVYDDFSNKSYTVLKMNGKHTDIQEIEYPDSLKQHIIEGLHTFFPSYNNSQNKAYHSFVCGNAEIFFLDTRSTRSANTESFRLAKSGRWKYKVPKGHLILDTTQMNWLLDGLKNSTADWKFIVSGVTFNQSYKKVLDICLRAQKRILPNGMNGAYVAASLASMWFAFPESQVKLLNYCHEQKIQNVIVLSGDAHTAAIDNGKNAGFPELMAGGLAQKNSKLAGIIKNNLRLNLWNKGGQGIGNTNYNDAFGEVTVHQKDSVTLAAIDKYGAEICSYTIKSGFIPQKYAYRPRTTIKKIRALKNLLKIALHL